MPKINELPTTVLHSRDHEVPAMKDGLAVKLTVAQFLSLIQKGDVDGLLGASDLDIDSADAGLAATQIQAALKELSMSSGTTSNALADTDVFAVRKTAGLRKVAWSDIKSIIGTALGAIVNAVTAKTTPVGGDSIPIVDSAAGNATKKLTLSNLVSNYLSNIFAALSGASFTGNVSTTGNLSATGNVTAAGDVATGAAGKLNVPGFFRAQQNGGNSLVELLPNSYFLQQAGSGQLTWYVAGIPIFSVTATAMGNLKDYIDVVPVHGAVKAYIVAKASTGTAAYGTIVSGANLILCDFVGNNPSGAPGGSWRVMSATITTGIPALLVRTS